MKNYEILDGLQREAQGMLKNAYDKGYKRGCEDCKADLNEEAYNKGLRHGQKLRIKEAECAEACGMKRAWEAARKILVPEANGGIPMNALNEIFGPVNVLEKFSASEAIEKIEAWEKKQDAPEDDVKIGDTVRILSQYRKDGRKLFPVGTIGKVGYIFKGSNEPYSIEVNDVSWYYSRDMFEVIKKDAPEINDGSIEVGDEVESKFDAYSMIVTTIDNKEVVGFDLTGRVTFMIIDSVKKTGNHYNIKDILDKMKEHEVKK